MSTKVTIYHNPKCSTSRKVLGFIKEAGIEPTIIEYLKDPPDEDELKRLLDEMGITARALLRKKEDLYKELGLGGQNVTETQAFEAMLADPILIERPIVEVGKKAVLCRPAEKVYDVLPK